MGSVYCHECQQYYEDSQQHQVKEQEGAFTDTDGSMVGKGLSFIEKCPKGHWLNIGSALGRSGQIFNYDVRKKRETPQM